MEISTLFAKPEVVWFIVGLALLLLEIASPGLVIFFFGVGAWIVSMACYFIPLSLDAQLILFIVASLLLLVFLRSSLKPLFYGFGSSKDMKEDMEEFAGETAVVIRPPGKGIKGRVEFRGSEWDAVSDEELEKGATVRIDGKDNITLKVSRI